MGPYEESEGEEEQPGKRPKTMGLRKALAKQKEEELTLVEKLSLTELLAMEIEHDRESWLERENIHLEAKLKKENEGLELQRKMTKYYAKKHKLVCAKLKEGLLEAQNLKEAKEHDSLGFLAEASLQLSKTP